MHIQSKPSKSLVAVDCGGAVSDCDAIGFGIGALGLEDIVFLSGSSLGGGGLLFLLLSLFPSTCIARFFFFDSFGNGTLFAFLDDNESEFEALTSLLAVARDGAGDRDGDRGGDCIF